MLLNFKYDSYNDEYPLVLPLKTDGPLLEGFNLNYSGLRLDEVFGPQGLLAKFDLFLAEVIKEKNWTPFDKEDIDIEREIFKEAGERLIKQFPNLNGTYRKYNREKASQVHEINYPPMFLNK